MILYVLSLDILSSYRWLCERLRRHSIGVGWFFVLALVSVWLVVRLADYAMKEGAYLPLAYYQIIFLIFLFFITKSAVETKRTVLRSLWLEYMFSFPISIWEIYIAKLLKELVYNLLLLGVATGLLTTMMLLTAYSFPLQPLYYLLTITAVIAGTLLGVPLALYASSTHHKRIIGTIIFAIPASCSYFVLKINAMYFPLILLVAVAAYFVPGRHFLEVWCAQVREKAQKSVGRLLQWCWKLPNTIFAKEVVLRVREKDVLGSIAALVFLFAAQVYIHRQVVLFVVDSSAMRALTYVKPLSVLMLIYLGCAIEIIIPVMAMFGRERKSLWLLKSLPTSPKTIIKGKLCGRLLFAPLILLLPIPLSLMYGFTAQLITFMMLASLTLIFISAAVGLFFSLMYPNMDPESDGNPEFVTMYSALIMALLLSLLLIGMPSYVFEKDHTLGILMQIFAADMAALLLCLAISWGDRVFARLIA